MCTVLLPPGVKPIAVKYIYIYIYIYISSFKSRRMRWTGHVARMGERTSAYRILVGRPERKISLGRLKRRWEDNIN
jgi:hypothetical protein